MKYISIAAILALITGCSGGGGVPGNPGGGQTNAQLAQQVLEACAQDNIDQLIEILGIIQGLADPGTPVPTLQITSIDIINLQLTWELDTGTDGVPDLGGTIRFDDGAGGLPTLDLSPIVNLGIAGLPQVLASLADGNRLIVDFDSTPPNTMGSIAVTFLNSLPSTADGQIDSVAVICSATITFMSTDVATLFLGGTPTATFDITMMGASGTVTGTMAFDGSNTVTFNVMLGADNFTFTFDIVTGQVTLVP